MDRVIVLLRFCLFSLILGSFSSTASATEVTYGSEDAWAKKVLDYQEHLDADVPLAKAFFPGAHNAFSAGNWGYPMMSRNQKYHPGQLASMGIREMSLDVHPAMVAGKYKPYLCHNSLAESAYCKETDRSFKEALRKIRDYINDDHKDSVFIIKIETYKSTLDKGHLRRVGQAINDAVGAKVYSPKQYSSDRGHGQCGSLPVKTLTKHDLLDDGKNIVIVTTANKARCHEFKNDAFRDWVWVGIDDTKGGQDIAGTKFPDAGGPKKCNEIADVNERMYRAVDESYGGGEVKYKSNQVHKYTECGVNIIEAAFIGSKGPDLSAFVWSWDKNEPNNANSGEDCAVVRPNKLMNDENCSNTHKVACKKTDGNWLVPPLSVEWMGAESLCQENNATFDVPYNAKDLEALRSAAIADYVWVAYHDIFSEGDWTKDLSLAHVSGRTQAYGGNRGTAFDEIDTVKTTYGSDIGMSRIIVNSGNRVDGIEVAFQNGDTYRHGSTGKGGAINVSSENPITKVEVCTGKYDGTNRVFSMKFTQKNGVSIEFGKQKFKSGGKKHSASSCASETGNKLVGFHGRAGSEIDAVGFYFKN